MSQLLINRYLNKLDQLQRITGANRETQVRDAFKRLLEDWGETKRLTFVAEYEFLGPAKQKNRVDGALLLSLRVPFGWWEAKDTGDDLDIEIGKKLRRGYPQDNIIFEDTRTAVLWQNRQETMRCAVDDTAALSRLLTLFFEHEPAPTRDFRKAVEQFKRDLPAVVEALRAMIDEAGAENPAFAAASAAFLAQAKETINPAITAADIREMLIQHILTEEVFANVFDNADFHRENNVAKALSGLAATFFTGDRKFQTLQELRRYYAAIKAAAAQIGSHGEKQTFLKVIYENFYKVYNAKAADRLGVVYTPNEIVRFMIESADWLCEKHFGKNLIDRDVEILDPATGTGTFIVELLEHFRGQPAKLKWKYQNELHANEVAILPYYVANLNIEATYAALTGEYAEFPNLCFVDTLDNVAALGIFSGETPDLFGAISDENVARVKRQNSRKISVVIGNPPYNAWQENFNQRNPNRAYRRVDERIKRTYVAEGTAQNKNSVYDMYTRFLRWASDRVKDDGIIAFIIGRKPFAKAAYDGFRKVVAREFAEIWVVDLGGDVRDNPKLSGTKHNVFGIQTGVAIAFFVKKKGKGDAVIRYAQRPEMEVATEKLSWLSGRSLARSGLSPLVPDGQHKWLDRSEARWDQSLPIAMREEGQTSIFEVFSNGLQTKRDEWIYDIDRSGLLKKAILLTSDYATALRANDHMVSIIKWDADLKRHLSNNIKKPFRKDAVSQAAYRPFTKRWAYTDPAFSSRVFKLAQLFPSSADNTAIVFSDREFRSDFLSLATGVLFDLHCGASADAYQGVARYRYTKDGDRLDNITDWALGRFQAHYGGGGAADPSPAGEGGPAKRGRVGSAASGEVTAAIPPPSGASRVPPPPAGGGSGGEPGGAGITKDDIFAYVYAVLHDPIYRETYALNLKREFPRIPYYKGFRRWRDWGQLLLDLHIGYETVEPYALTRLDVQDERAKKAGLAPKPILKADREAGVINLDTETQLAGVPALAWTYRLGNRSALDWVLDQHKEKTPKDPTIRERFNTYRFADHKERVVDLLARVTTVSVRTQAIVEAMRASER